MMIFRICGIAVFSVSVLALSFIVVELLARTDVNRPFQRTIELDRSALSHIAGWVGGMMVGLALIVVSAT